MFIFCHLQDDVNHYSIEFNVLPMQSIAWRFSISKRNAGAELIRFQFMCAKMSARFTVQEEDSSLKFVRFFCSRFAAEGNCSYEEKPSILHRPCKVQMYQKRNSEECCRAQSTSYTTATEYSLFVFKRTTICQNVRQAYYIFCITFCVHTTSTIFWTIYTVWQRFCMNAFDVFITSCFISQQDYSK